MNRIDEVDNEEAGRCWLGSGCYGTRKQAAEKVMF